MPVAHLNRTIQDELSGGLLVGAQVTVCSPGSTDPIPVPMFADVTLTQQLPNPFTSGDGVVDVYFAEQLTVALWVNYGTQSTLMDYLPVLPAAEDLFISPTPLVITNSPGVNSVLQGVDGQTASWAPVALAGSVSGIDILGWFLAEAFQLSAIGRDSFGAIRTAQVSWPDGTPGVYTADAVSLPFPGRVDAWHVTWDPGATPGLGAQTYTQPPLVRDSTGDVIDRPAVIVTVGTG